MTGKGEAGPGLHIYCFYENDYEFEIVNPFFWDGFHHKYPFVEHCWHDTTGREVAEALIWDEGDFKWFWERWL